MCFRVQEFFAIAFACFPLKGRGDLKSQFLLTLKYLSQRGRKGKLDIPSPQAVENQLDGKCLSCESSLSYSWPSDMCTITAKERTYIHKAAGKSAHFHSLKKNTYRKEQNNVCKRRTFGLRLRDSEARPVQRGLDGQGRQGQGGAGRRGEDQRKVKIIYF